MTKHRPPVVIVGTKYTKEERVLMHDPIVQAMAAEATREHDLECFAFMVAANREYERRCTEAQVEPKHESVGGVARAIRRLIATEAPLAAERAAAGIEPEAEPAHDEPDEDEDEE